jgi:hypothetical protein
LSSAFLYLAIVAIWAGVLVPRWLRPHVHRAQAEPDGPHEEEPESHHGEEAHVQDEEAAPPRPGRARRPADSSRSGRHARVLKTRRRMLATLVLLTAGAAGIAVAHVAATWVIIPPAVMLAGFLLLLRAAAPFDTQRIAPPTHGAHPTADGAGQKPAREEGAAARTRRAAPGPGSAGREGPVPGRRGKPEWEEAEPGWVAVASAADSLPGAEIIDISGRVRDQVYDQYSDAAERAVGD